MLTYLAHIIRRQSTVLYRTVADLRARSRWCLTGTPVQNRLEDIGSLLAFLRVTPFHTLSTFRKYISIPFDEGPKRREYAVQNFTQLLDSMLLRRTKDLLQLPDQHFHFRRLTFSPEEKAQYDQTRETMSRTVRHQGGVFDENSALGMFQVQLQLRILCNHGTWQQPFSWTRHKLHLLDNQESLAATIGHNSETTCTVCRQTMPLMGHGSMFHQFTEKCQHVLCLDCLGQILIPGQESIPADCPLCSHLWGQSTSLSSEEDYFRLKGRSSKMEALMSDVLTDFRITKR